MPGPDYRTPGGETLLLSTTKAPTLLSRTPAAYDVASDAGTGADGRPKFPKDELGFLAELRRQVDIYFADGRRDRDCWQMYLKTATILAWLATSYALLVFAAPTVWLAAPLSISLALAISAVGFSIQHDGGHHAYSRFSWVNRLAALSLDLIGASSYLWRWKHVVLHHTYPNVDGQDTDIDVGVVARLSPGQPRLWFHRWQHLYIWVLYALTAPRWHLFGDFKDVALGASGPHRVSPDRKVGTSFVSSRGKRSPSGCFSGYLYWCTSGGSCSHFTRW